MPNPTATAVPVYLPLGFIGAGILGLLLLASELWGALPSSVVYVRHNAHLLVLVHLFTLVWGSGVTLGVLHQMAPVILSAQLFSVRIGWVTLALFVPGSFFLALSFRTFWLAGVIAGGVLVVLGALLFMYNIARTLRASDDRSVTSRYLVASLVSFIGTLLFGIAMAASLRLGAGYDLIKGLMLSHLFLGGAGWFAGIVIAVSYRLVPMFLLVHGHEEKFAHRFLAVHYAGVALGVAGSIWGGPGGALLGILLIFAAVIMWAVDMRGMWQKRNRKPDVWMRQVPISIAFLVVAVFGAVGCGVWDALGSVVPPRAMLAVGALFALGFVSTMVLTLLHKIVPFLVWYHRFSGTVGRGRTPAMKDLVHEGVGKYVFPIYYAAVALIVVAAAFDWVPLAQYAAIALVLACAMLAHDLVWLILPIEQLWARLLGALRKLPAG